MVVASLLLYQVDDINTIPGVAEVLKDLEAQTEISVKSVEVPATAGELAGIATEILVSVPVQALINAAALGALLWKIIDLAKKAGKEVFIEKGIVKPLLASKAKEELGEESLRDKDALGSVRVWGR